MTLLIATGTALTVFFGLQALYWLRRARSSALESHLRARVGLGAPGAALLRRRRWLSTEDLLEQAGLDWGMRGLALRVAVAAAALALVGEMALGPPGIGLALAAFPLLRLYAQWLRARRLERVNRQLPQALELLVLSLRAGHPLEQAVALVAAEGPLPIASELGRVVDEHRIGRPLEEAFAALGYRLDGCEAVRTLVLGVSVLHGTGGNLVEVIEQILATLSAQAHYRMRLRAATAQGRVAGATLAFLPLAFGLLVALVQPSYAALLVTPAGRPILALSGLLWLFGVVWLRALVRPRT
ncbi:MAG TPA: type II secretion system F family protein [Polyangia bacterium]|nr:type II secretion system F family protein [Polyangia bacterium]